MVLQVRDSLSGLVRTVRPRAGAPLTLYVCGPTVYDAAHVGHARTYLRFDLLRRRLRFDRVPVRHIMNITDVEDKITARAMATGLPWRELARREETRFKADLRALRLLPADRTPRASAYVGRMAEVARSLERTGRVRRTSEGWMYSPDPAHAAQNFPVGEELERHSVPEPDHPFPLERGGAEEFLLWKPQVAPNPSFPSPWGRGVPGWHLECYTMAHDLLGIPVDLHGGGLDLVFPHHFAENEVALTLDGTPFSRTFIHTAFVTQGGVKMSKSIGNLVPLSAALDAVGADALRWYLLTPPASLRLPWSDGAAVAAKEELGRVRRALRASLALGGSGAVSAARFQRLARTVARNLGDGLRAHDALEEIREFARVLEGRPEARVAPGERRAARSALGDVESLLGIALG
jgi:cysteinyl-tRNA synthetase